LSKRLFFAGEPALSKLGTDTGVGAARGAAACGWVVCANDTHVEAKDVAIRLFLTLVAAARQQIQRKKLMAVQWPRGREPTVVSSQYPPVCPPAHPTHRKNLRQNGDRTTRKSTVSIFPAAPPKNIAKKRAQPWHMAPPRSCGQFRLERPHLGPEPQARWPAVDRRLRHARGWRLRS